MKVGVLAVQGAFLEHEKVLTKLGADYIELRQECDLSEPFDALILPGGESTVQGKLLKELNLFERLKEKIEGGMPVLGTCAGLILLAGRLSNDAHTYFGTLPVTVKRNAYGRQLGSFYTREAYGKYTDFPMTFIRAPYIKKVEDGVKIMAKVEEDIVAVQYKNQIGLSFHPELNDDLRIHQQFLELV